MGGHNLLKSTIGENRLVEKNLLEVFQEYVGKHSKTDDKSRGIILEKDDLLVYLFVSIHVPETDVFTFVEFLGPSWLCMVHLSEVLVFEHQMNPVMIEVDILREFFLHSGHLGNAVCTSLLQFISHSLNMT